MHYFLLTLEYDGYDYSGWVKQNSSPSIQQELEKALMKVAHLSIWTLGASKTDKYVHALAQKVLIKLPFYPKNINFFFTTVSAKLPANINIKDFTNVNENFNVRSTIIKKYVYLINDDVYDVKNYRYEWKINEKLNVEVLQEIAKVFIGTYNFKFFSGVKEYEQINTIRIINDIKIIRNAQKKIEIIVTGPSFIRYQIRMIVGNIIAVAQQKQTIAKIKLYLANPPQVVRTHFCAPGWGLCLANILY